MDKIIRTILLDTNKIELCKHINIDGEEQSEENIDDCEYIETLNIYCKICKIEHNITILSK